jgi:hypothetical protein
MAIGITKYQTRGVPRQGAVPPTFGPSPIQQRATGTGYTSAFTPTITPAVDTDVDLPEIDLSGSPTDTGITSTSGSGTSGAAGLMNAETARRKFEAEQAAGTAAATRAQTGAQAQAAYLRSLLGQGVPSSITGEIGAQETAGRSYINTQAQNLLERLAGALTTGQQFTTQGYDTLRNYLTANPAQAYAQAQRAVPTVTNNALAQYMQAQGVDPSMAQPAVDQANLAALGGATNYNQLLNVLSGAEASGQASRMSEEQMARALAGSQLQSIYGSGRANVESEQLSALNALATQISNARIAAQQAQTAQEQAIQNALAAVYGTGYTTPPPVPVTGTETETVTETVAPAAPVQSAPIARLASQVANVKNQTLANRANAFIEANPTATPAQVAKAFPSLTAAAKKKK